MCMKIEWKKIVYQSYEIGSVVFLIIVACLGALALYSKYSPSTPFHLYSVVSGSMQPELPVGSVIMVMKQKDYYVNDVITYFLGSQKVTHRIVYAGSYYLTKGDANSAIDPQTVTKSNVIGKVVLSAPLVGYIQESTKSFLGLLIYVLLPASLIILHESWIIVKEFQKLDFRKVTLRSTQALIFLVLLGLASSGQVLAYYSKAKGGLTIQISTANDFVSPSPTPLASPTPVASVTPLPTAIPTITPSPTPTIIPSPSGYPCPTVGVGNCGNGAGSSNNVIVEEENTTEVSQNNNSTVSTTVNVTSNTGNNSGGQSGGTVLTIEVNSTNNSNFSSTTY